MEPEIKLPIFNYTHNKEHYDTYKLFKESDNEYTVVHFTKNNIIGLDVPDSSIFKESEWYKIKVIINELSDISSWTAETHLFKTDTQCRNEEYLLKNPKQLEILKGFKNFTVELFKTPQDIYDYLYVKDDKNHKDNVVPETTINKFRNWLSKHHESIVAHYNYVVLNISESELKTKTKIDEIKKEQEYFTNLVMEIENIGYNFQESSGTYEPLETSDLNELDDIMEIENHCRKIRQLINNIYSNKIKGLTKK
jgi:hypothetical protein